MAMLTEEQTMLRDTAREWAQNEAPVSAFRKVRDAGGARGFDPALYRRMAEMGWAGIVIPETYGGSGMNVRSLGLVLQETAKTLTASPLLVSAIAAIAIARAGSEAQKQAWLPRIASGETIATLAIDEGPRHDPDKVETRAERSGDGWKLSGAKAFVAEGDAAGLFVVAARTSKGAGLFLVPADAKGVARSARRMTDARSHADIRFSDVQLDRDALLGEEDGKSRIDNVLDAARAATAAEMLGMAEQAFQTTLDYLKTRVQFGQPLATFQALQHRMANLFTEIELARSAVEGALDAVDFGAGAGRLVSLAKAHANDTLHLASNEMVQLHGGIGMTDEHDAGFYLKRARVLEGAWGNSAFHRERFARLSGY